MKQDWLDVNEISFACPYHLMTDILKLPISVSIMVAEKQNFV